MDGGQDVGPRVPSRTSRAPRPVRPRRAGGAPRTARWPMGRWRSSERVSARPVRGSLARAVRDAGRAPVPRAHDRHRIGQGSRARPRRWATVDESSAKEEQNAVLAHTRWSSRRRAGPDARRRCLGRGRPDLSRTLRAGGLVVVLRHAATDYSNPTRIPSSSPTAPLQRNLSAQGRADARTIGRGMRRLGLPIGKVHSSAYCRTLETARLAFGRATVHLALLNTIAAEHDAVWRKQITDARRLLGTRPAFGKLTVLVTCTASSCRRRQDRLSRRARRSSFARSAAAASESSAASGRAEWGTLRRKTSTGAARLRGAGYPYPPAPTPDVAPARTGRSGTARHGQAGPPRPETGKTTRVPLETAPRRTA